MKETAECHFFESEMCNSWQETLNDSSLKWQVHSHKSGFIKTYVSEVI